MTESIIEIRGVTKRFLLQKPAVLKQITTSIPKGQIVGVVGPDGAGKTTLIRLMAGLLIPSEGELKVAGYDTIQDAERVHELAGYMPQKFGLYEDLTVQQNLDLYAALRNVTGDEKKERVESLLKFTQLGEFTGRLAKNLSGGMKQKLGLACALIKKPTVLLLDEPTVGVDPISRRELWKMVTALAEEKISIVWSTAYLNEAEQCHHVLLLSEGEVLYDGAPHTLTAKMSGRVFTTSEAQQERRELLFELLKQKSVMDGVIQGDRLRIVLRKGADMPGRVQLEAATPRFEDGFIDILGGGPGGTSTLADKVAFVQDGVKIPILAQNLTKKFGQFTAVDSISLQVKKGEIFGLLGPNGAGKTTTFKMLCGLLHPTSGKAYVNDLDLEKAPGVARATIGYMAQKFSLYGNLSVKQNLDFFAGVYNLKNRAKKEAIEEMIEVFNLQEYLTLSAEELSLGYKQRLSLASATMHRPSVIFLDEPTSGVDPMTRREFWNHINGLVGKGVTIMITTHFMDEAEYCDRIALVYRGKIIQEGTPSGLKELAKSPENSNPTLEDTFIRAVEGYDGH